MIPPPDLLYIAELITPRIFFRLILHLRNFKYVIELRNLILFSTHCLFIDSIPEEVLQLQGVILQHQRLTPTTSYLC